jgi:hypothetical protein
MRWNPRAGRGAARIYRSGVERVLSAPFRAPVLTVNAWVSERVLAAPTELDLDEAILDVASDAELYRRFESLSPDELKYPDQLAARRWDAIAESFAGAPGLIQGLQEFALVVSCLWPIVEAAGGVSATPNDDPLWFTYDPTVPPAIGEALLAGMQSGVALMVIEDVALRTGIAPAWQRTALVSRWVPQQHHFLRLLASMPENSERVPLHVVPSSERFDLEELNAQTAAFNTWTAQTIDRATTARHQPT